LADLKGEIRYGDVGDTDPLKASKAKIVKGDIFSSSYSITSETADIKEILCPISLKDVRTLRCLGLNYEQYFLPKHFHSFNPPSIDTPPFNFSFFLVMNI